MIQTAYYHAAVCFFVQQSVDEILGQLTRNHSFALEGTQRDAWRVQVSILQKELAALDRGVIYFEFAIPRMGKRADVVLLVDGVAFVLEFKVGSSGFDRSAITQVHDYALDLKNFHRGSHALAILPILIATRAPACGEMLPSWAQDQVANPVLSNGDGLVELINAAARLKASAVDPADWQHSGYLPTPTIIEAAQALYQNHAVEEIARSDAGAQNLSATTAKVREIIALARDQQKKVICFITGVPGSGKTLAGLNIATDSARNTDAHRAVFLSGNGPLVAVLREALARDQVDRTGCRKTDATREVSSFVQNIHHFRDDALRDDKPPAERIVIFDEAQRAWTRDQASKFMQAKRGQSDFDLSEPEFLIGVMDRFDDWSVIICLVGGGQEINTGEAGLSEWMKALGERFANWEVHAPDRLADPDYALSGQNDWLVSAERVHWSPSLHLSVSMRSFRAESLSGFVGHLLSNQPELAKAEYEKIRDRYPIVLTRDLSTARLWIRQKARGSERTGLIASSGAGRLKPEGINVRASIEPENWFLNGPEDVRSSFYLEDAATEFDVQGLELDWAVVGWDADLRYADGEWQMHSFRGTAWQNVISSDRRLFLKNAYRVILTRARQGMAIFVPVGNQLDHTRSESYYDQTAEYPIRCGLPTDLRL